MWFFYALSFAIWGGLGVIIAKSKFKNIPSAAVPFFVLLFALPSILGVLLFTTGIPQVTQQFYFFVIASGVLDSIAFVLAFMAIKKTDVSLIAPMSAFSPVITTIIAIFVLNEVPTPFKFLGIISVVIGSYLLNISEAKHGIFSPFKKLFGNSGVLLFLTSTLIWSVTPILQKSAILETSPITPLFASFGGLMTAFLVLFPFAIRVVMKNMKTVKEKIHWFLIYGVGTAFSQYGAYTAFSLANVGYVSSIMRLEIVVIIILGGRLLKEKITRQRLVGAGVMILGALILAS